MNFDPSTIWSWYRMQPPWKKALSFVFVIILVVLAAAVIFLAKGRFSVSDAIDGPDPLQDGKDATEKHFRNEYEKATEKDDELKKRIEEQDTKRCRLAKERKYDFEETNERHKAIDAAADFESVDGLLEDRSE